MYEAEEKQKLVKKELAKIKKIYANMNENVKKNVEKLAENAAWMAVSLEELRQEIDENGYTEIYTNGVNQVGTKDSTYVKTYAVMIKNYNSVVKLLLDQLPEHQQAQTGDALAQFLLKK